MRDGSWILRSTVHICCSWEHLLEDHNVTQVKSTELIFFRYSVVSQNIPGYYPYDPLMKYKKKTVMQSIIDHSELC